MRSHLLSNKKVGTTRGRICAKKKLFIISLFFIIFILISIFFYKQNSVSTIPGQANVCDHHNVRIEAGEYDVPIEGKSQARQVVVNWINTNIVGPMKQARSVLMNNTADSVNGTLDDSDPAYNQFHTYIDPLYVKYPSERPLNETEVTPIDDYLNNIVTEIELVEKENNRAYHIKLHFNEGRTDRETFRERGILLPRGAGIHTIHCNNAINKDRRSPNCIPRDLELKNGKIYKFMEKLNCY